MIHDTGDLVAQIRLILRTRATPEQIAKIVNGLSAVVRGHKCLLSVDYKGQADHTLQMAMQKLVRLTDALESWFTDDGARADQDGLPVEVDLFGCGLFQERAEIVEFRARLLKLKEAATRVAQW